jgi:hypothetical protein
LSLSTRFVAVRRVVVALLIARLVRTKHAALHATNERVDPILPRRAQQSVVDVELGVLFRLAFEIEQPIEALFDVIKAEAEAGAELKLHQRFGRGGRCVGEAEQLQRNAEGPANPLGR